MQHPTTDPADEFACCPPARPYGPRRRVGQSRRCRECRRPVDPESRRSLCRVCIRAKDRGTVVQGPCEVCRLADRRMLALVTLADGSTAVLCANDQALLVAPVGTLEQLRLEAAFRAELRPSASCLDTGLEAGVVTAAAERAA